MDLSAALRPCDVILSVPNVNDRALACEALRSGLVNNMLMQLPIKRSQCFARECWAPPFCNSTGSNVSQYIPSCCSNITRPSYTKGRISSRVLRILGFTTSRGILSWRCFGGSLLCIRARPGINREHVQDDGRTKFWRHRMRQRCCR